MSTEQSPGLGGGELPKIDWIKKTSKHNWNEDGSVYLVAVPVKNINQPWRGEYWDIDKIEVCCDGEECHFQHYRSDEPYDAWDWDSVEWFAVIEGRAPVDGPKEDE